jgi:hypothetical protein
MVAGLDASDALSHAFDYSSSFVSEDAGEEALRV